LVDFYRRFFLSRDTAVGIELSVENSLTNGVVQQRTRLRSYYDCDYAVLYLRHCILSSAAISIMSFSRLNFPDNQKMNIFIFIYIYIYIYIHTHTYICHPHVYIKKKKKNMSLGSVNYIFVVRFIVQDFFSRKLINL